MERRELGRSAIDLPVVGLLAGRRFDVRGKEAQSARTSLVHAAIARGIDFFATSPSDGEAERVLAASLAGQRKRATVLTTITDGDEAGAHRQVDRSLHFFDGWVDLYVLDSRRAPRSMLDVLVRMRRAGEAGAIGVTCATMDQAARTIQLVADLECDVVLIPASLLLQSTADQFITSLAIAGAGVVTLLPDAPATALERAGNRVVQQELTRFGVVSWSDLLLKLSLSDRRVIAAAVPFGRATELDAIGGPSTPPWFGRSERELVRASPTRTYSQ